MGYKEATATLIAYLEEKGLGKGKVNFRLRDAIFGRQRYWGEPIPIYYKDGTAYGVAEADLPLVLPEIDEYKPPKPASRPGPRPRLEVPRPARVRAEHHARLGRLQLVLPPLHGPANADAS